MSHAGQVAAGTDGGAVDGGDGGNVEAVEGERNFLDAAPVVFPDFGGVPAAKAFRSRKSLTLPPAQKALPPAPVTISTLTLSSSLDLLAGGDDGVPLGRAGERVALGGGVEGEGGDGAILVEDYTKSDMAVSGGSAPLQAGDALAFGDEVVDGGIVVSSMPWRRSAVSQPRWR